MHKVIPLSYTIDEGTPAYPGTRPLVICKDKEIQSGDSCNTFSITLSNHFGTHIDMPRHFFDSGINVKDCQTPAFICMRPIIIDCPKRPGESIEVKDLVGLPVGRKQDALLIRTGFSAYRTTDAWTYCNNNPLLSPDAARWIRQNLLDVKIVGIDAISISSKAHKGLGAKSHEILLVDGGYGGDPVFILEDLYLPPDVSRLDELLVFPVFSADIDGSPCVVMGIIHD